MQKIETVGLGVFLFLVSLQVSTLGQASETKGLQTADECRQAIWNLGQITSADQFIAKVACPAFGTVHKKAYKSIVSHLKSDATNVWAYVSSVMASGDEVDFFRDGEIREGGGVEGALYFFWPNQISSKETASWEGLLVRFVCLKDQTLLEPEFVVERSNVRLTAIADSAIVEVYSSQTGSEAEYGIAANQAINSALSFADVLQNAWTDPSDVDRKAKEAYIVSLTVQNSGISWYLQWNFTQEPLGVDNAISAFLPDTVSAQPAWQSPFWVDSAGSPTEKH